MTAMETPFDLPQLPKTEIAGKCSDLPQWQTADVPIRNHFPITVSLPAVK